MKKFLIICITLSFFAFSANAAVQFLPDALGGKNFKQKKHNSHVSDNEQKCKNEGYKLTNCSPYRVEKSCPYKSTFKKCCGEGYDYTKKQCQDAGFVPSETSCGGYYRCLEVQQ